MIIELIAMAIMAFSLGSYVTRDRDVVIPIRQLTPDVWPPTDHKELLKTCAIMCGEGRLQSYDVLYGKCRCKL